MDEIREADAKDAGLIAKMTILDTLSVPDKRRRLVMELTPRLTDGYLFVQRDMFNRILRAALGKKRVGRDVDDDDRIVPSHAQLKNRMKRWHKAQKTPCGLLKRVTRPKRRMSWSLEHVAQLLRSPIYFGSSSPKRRSSKATSRKRFIIRDAIYWVPLIMITMGVRPEEILQAAVPDVIRRDGILCLFLGHEEDAVLKSEQSRRILPIPQILLDLGFHQWVLAKIRAEETWLFPEVQPDQAHGRRSQIFGSRLRGLLKTLKLHSDREDIYAMRRTLTVIIATPMDERNEAIRDVVFSAFAGFLLLGILVAFVAYRSVKRSVSVIADLSTEIEAKDAQNLTPINRQNTFAEIEPAIDTIDTLMARLEAALTAERQFSTNAAHELRTPVAISLAHVQRLQIKLTTVETRQNAMEIEQGLKRLTRLIERMLQMSRAQSGLGISAEHADIVPVINLLLRELADRVPSSDALVVTSPQGIWMSNVDPDAVGIILNNLFENAIRHASGDGPLTVDASQTGQIVISNDCEPLSLSDLEAIKQRHTRRAAPSSGFGLGLAIVQDFCDQSGSMLEISSPPQGTLRGFAVTLTLKIASSRP